MRHTVQIDSGAAQDEGEVVLLSEEGSDEGDLVGLRISLRTDKQDGGLQRKLVVALVNRDFNMPMADATVSVEAGGAAAVEAVTDYAGRAEFPVRGVTEVVVTTPDYE